jgi:Tfp pilus assembly protein PilP
MKKILIVALGLISVACNKTHSIADFKRYNSDAPNRVVQPIGNFMSFDLIDYSQQDNGDFVVSVGYNTKTHKCYKAIGIFKYNGKQIYFESGQ